MYFFYQTESSNKIENYLPRVYSARFTAISRLSAFEARHCDQKLFVTVMTVWRVVFRQKNWRIWTLTEKDISYADIWKDKNKTHKQHNDVVCCRLNNTRGCDEHLLGQVSTHTGQNQLPIFHCTKCTWEDILTRYFKRVVLDYNIEKIRMNSQHT